MRGAGERLASFWDALPLFRKIYICVVLFIGAFAMLGEFGEYVAGDLLQRGGESFSSVQELLLWIFFTFIVAALEASVLISVLKKIIGHFTSVIYRLSGGDLAARVSPEMADRKDELGLLARAFNSMAEQREQERTRERALIADVSHELRSPLTRLSVTVELLRREQIPPRLLDRLCLETERMEALIESMLAYSRMEARLHSASFDLAELVRDVAEDVRFEGSVRGCLVEEDLPKSLFFAGDAEMLRHAVENVLRNALRYTPDDGSIVIRLTSGRETCLLEVEDRGPGVPEDALEQIFRPFFRVDASRRRESGGTGMGLSLAERAAHAHGGRIWAENRKEGGLRVSMELPLEQGAEGV
ncbi:cell wall metabolism sensor histidine kinase WalK [Mailhella massiliensis]|uniref:histidine kinase n=1 Tax=Mailhella massiliensis TaxID=1903261 RepID=A0A921DSA6_9BACT|nr:ATP-binding protein [Mailhella massiliensis]HJD97953.1 HAMP domain-containing protein [Mailhella massiliensis]